ncbi:hypothetical protein ACFGVR_00930 [Mucilaginibacter sp. AW1-3]
MRNTESSINQTKPSLKTWTEPQIILISTNQINAKNIPQVHEHTGHYVTLPSVSYRAKVNDAGSKVVSLTSGGVVKHHVSSLAS